MPTPRVPLCAAAAVVEEEVTAASHGGEEYAVYVKDGVYYVTQDFCTHGPGRMSEGYVEDNEVECPFHQGRFDFTTGAVTAAPCMDPLRTWTATVEDGQVCIDPSETRA